jgi:phosphoglycerate dehydrogenase-like enzyme
LPLPPQFNSIDVVIDFGGSVGTDAMADVARSVLLWHVLGNGIDHFDLEYFRAKNICVANCPGKNTGIPLAEMAPYVYASTCTWLAHSGTESASRSDVRSDCSEIDGRTLGLVGFGATGRELAQRASAFGMRVIGVDKEKFHPPRSANLGLHRCAALNRWTIC